MKENEHFLKFILLNSDKKQVYTLMKNLNKSQIHTIREIIFNLPNIPLNKKHLTFIIKNRKLVNKLGKKTNIRVKQNLLKKNYKQIYQILFTLRKNLLDLYL